MSETVPQADQVAARFGAGALDAAAAVLVGEIPDGAELLRVLVDEVEGYDDARTRALAVAGLLADPDQLDAVGLAYRRRRAGVLAELMRLEQVAGMKRHAAMLRTAIREAAGAAAGRPCEVEIDGGTWWCPAGWSIDAEGLWRVVMRGGEPSPQLVAHAPIILRRRLRDLDGQAEVLEVAWARGDRWRSVLCPRGEIADARALLKISGVGAPVHSANVADVVRWLADFEAANTLPTGWTSPRMGWIGKGGEYFLAGSRLLRAEDAEDRDIRLMDTDPGVSQLAAAVRERGTAAGWRAVWTSVAPHPAATLAVYAACAAVLLPIIEEAPNFAIDWSGDPGTGKTTSLRLAASVWGLPEEGAGYLRSWLGSITGIERTAAALSGFPVCLDESNKVPLAERARFGQLVYMLANGSGKLRGSITGMQRTATWRAPILSTGENRLTDYTQDEGARARVVCIVGAPLGPNNATLAETVRAELLANHGHLGPAWAGWAIKKRAEWGDWRARYRALVDSWGDDATTPMGRRAAQYIALLDLAASLLQEGGLLTRPAACPIAFAFDAAQRGGEVADRPAAALRVVYEWATSAPAAFYGRHRAGREDEPIQPPGGWRGSWEEGPMWTRIGAFPNQVAALLKANGFEPEAVIGSWKSRDWLVCAKSGDAKGRTYPMPVDGTRPRLLVIRREAFRAIGAEGGGDE